MRWRKEGGRGRVVWFSAGGGNRVYSSRGEGIRTLWHRIHSYCLHRLPSSTLACPQEPSARLAMARPLYDYPVPSNFSEHVFKTVEGVEVKLRIWPADEASDGRPRPWVWYAHGGAWFFGKPQLPNAWVVPGLRSRGYHVVGIGYRKCPQVWLKDIIDDGMDAWLWCRDNLEGILGETAVDIDRYVLSGESAGGNIALLVNQRITSDTSLPPAAAIFSCYAPTDMLAGLGSVEAFNWSLSGEFTAAEIEGNISDSDPSHAMTVCCEECHVPVEVFREQWQDPTFTHTERDRLQFDTCKYLLLQGRLMRVVLRTGEDGASPEQSEGHAREWSPLHLLDHSTGHPPTYFLHGDADCAVPMEVHTLPYLRRLRSMGVQCAVSIMHGKGHAQDNLYTVSNNRDVFQTCIEDAKQLSHQLFQAGMRT
jgi:acetyl esterase/lipase